MKKGLLLDRDGVINREIGRHVTREDEFELLPDIVPFLREALRMDFTIVVISNQSGIAKGLYDHATVERLHRRLEDELEKKGVRVHDFFYAPHHPSKGRSLFRKPDSLMLERALAKHGISPERALFFGDKGTDKEAGVRAGVRTILVEPNSSLMPYLNELERIG